MAIFAALAASALGGLMNSSAQKKAAKAAAAASQYKPTAVIGAGGYTSIGKNNTVTAHLDPTSKMYQGGFSDIFSNIAGGGGFGQGAQDFANMYGNAMLPGIFQGAMGASQQIPTGAFDAYTQNALNNAAFGQGFGMNALAQASNFGGQQTGINEGLAQSLFGRANEALAKDFTGLANDQLARSRALARPEEERQVNSKFQNLYNRGVLSQTGGAAQIGQLAQAQEMADIQRQNSADTFAMNQLQNNRNFAANMFGQGLQGRGMDQQFNLGAGNLFAGMGNNMMTFGANQAANALGAQVDMSDLINSRGQQRLQNVTNLLGFGQDISNNNLNQMLAAFGANSQINADQRALMALSMSGGANQAQAGNNAGNYMMQGGFSPFGSFLGSLGGGYLKSKGVG